MKRFLMAATLIALSSECVRPTWRSQQDSTVKMPRLDETTGALVVDGPVLQALRVAADDFLPPTYKPRACADTQTAFKYFASRRGNVIFVRIEENPSYCGAKYHSLDSGARYAISSDGRILRRVLDGEAETPFESEAHSVRDGGTELIDVTALPGASPPWSAGADAGATEQPSLPPPDGGVPLDAGTTALSAPMELDGGVGADGGTAGPASAPRGASSGPKPSKRPPRKR